jgi:hypothetical protein
MNKTLSLIEEENEDDFFTNDEINTSSFGKANLADSQKVIFIEDRDPSIAGQSPSKDHDKSTQSQRGE